MVGLILSRNTGTTRVGMYRLRVESFVFLKRGVLLAVVGLILSRNTGTARVGMYRLRVESFVFSKKARFRP